MSDKTNINPKTVGEEALLYKSLQDQGIEVDELNLPDPTPGDEWLLKEAGYDRILHGLLLSQEENETTWSKALKGGHSQDEYYRAMDQYDLAHWGLNKAIEKRKRELADKEKS